MYTLGISASANVSFQDPWANMSASWISSSCLLPTLTIGHPSTPRILAHDGAIPKVVLILVAASKLLVLCFRLAGDFRAKYDIAPQNEYPGPQFDISYVPVVALWVSGCFPIGGRVMRLA
jgi:hypothetical protein